MDDLIARLEKATGPNFALECEIAAAVGYGSMPPPNYTASVDTALTLVELPDWDLKSARHRRGYVALLFGQQETFRADATTPALALCIAALKARAALAGIRG